MLSPLPPDRASRHGKASPRPGPGRPLNLYAESSAVLAWLLGEPDGDIVRVALTDADEVLTSDLTLVECDRALIRARIVLRLRESEITRRRRALETAASHWSLLRISPAITERARQPFPGDPVRALDAVHLASALGAAETADDLAVLSLDHRVRRSARALGLQVLPAG